MMRSLLADAEQSGCLPRWPYANGQSMTMVGDSADPILASAAAFGAGAFDRRAALAAMVRGATKPCRSANGEYLQRQGLAQYMALGYVPFDLDTNTRNANSIYGDPDARLGLGGDHARVRGRRLRDRPVRRPLAPRPRHLRRLHAPLRPTGATSSTRPAAWSSRASPTGTSRRPTTTSRGGGFVEGNSAQYTWMVPQDPGGLIARMGGPRRAAARLDRFLRELNGGPGGTHTDHALLGNEPTLQTPWLYDWMRRPYRTQAAVRRALLTLYDTSPDGYPGNDDLGTLSSWYVFGALGLYPEVPGVGVLAIGSPLFARTEIRLPHRRRALILASASEVTTSGAGKKRQRQVHALSPAAAPYIQSLRLDGRAYAQALDHLLRPRPRRHALLPPRAAPATAAGVPSAAAAPPSFGPQPADAARATAPREPTLAPACSGSSPG